MSSKCFTCLDVADFFTSFQSGKTTLFGYAYFQGRYQKDILYQQLMPMFQHKQYKNTSSLAIVIESNISSDIIDNSFTIKDDIISQMKSENKPLVFISLADLNKAKESLKIYCFCTG